MTNASVTLRSHAMELSSTPARFLSDNPTRGRNWPLAALSAPNIYTMRVLYGRSRQGAGANALTEKTLSLVLTLHHLGLRWANDDVAFVHQPTDALMTSGMSSN